MANLLEIAKSARPQAKLAEKTVRAAPPATPFIDYALPDLEEIDRLIRELAKLENWDEGYLASKLDQRQRMAPVNVIPVLREIRAAHKAALAVWPDKPAKRSDVRLCRLDHV